eukprot:06922.XXX_283594_283719_1 [CDS] Oithona nana genome sequencing.
MPLLVLHRTLHSDSDQVSLQLFNFLFNYVALNHDPYLCKIR